MRRCQVKPDAVTYEAFNEACEKSQDYGMSLKAASQMQKHKLLSVQIRDLASIASHSCGKCQSYALALGSSQDAEEHESCRTCIEHHAMDYRWQRLWPKTMSPNSPTLEAEK